MISPSVIAEIARMLREGTLSETKIARQAGVSRGTVATVRLATRSVPTFVDGPSGPLSRCPICGSWSEISSTGDACFACRVRRGKRRRIHDAEGSADDFALDLREDHKEGYDEVNEALGRPERS